jgi:hypothetical protein
MFIANCFATQPVDTERKDVAYIQVELQCKQGKENTGKYHMQDCTVHEIRIMYIHT